MFVGHAAVAALAGAARPRIPLVPLLVAAYAADAAEILLHGFGHQQAMLWTHSAIALLAGGVLAAALALVIFRSRDAALVVGLVYASHGLCDLLTGLHKPMWDGGPTYGFGLYQRPVVDFAIEVGLVLAAAIAWHVRRPVRRPRLALTVAVVVLLQLGFNLGDRARLHRLKRSLSRATGAALASPPASRAAAPASGDRMALALETATTSSGSV